jgi:hypothetical protein
VDSHPPRIGESSAEYFDKFNAKRWRSRRARLTPCEKEGQRRDLIHLQINSAPGNFAALTSNVSIALHPHILCRDATAMAVDPFL